MLRTFICLVLLFTATVQAVGQESIRYYGRPVVEVIDEFRAAGQPFAYSTGLVPESLLVLVEPTATDPRKLVAEILAPHDLTLRTEAGVYLVVRIDQDQSANGTILVQVFARRAGDPVEQPFITIVPDLPGGDQLSPGALEYSDVAPGRYQITAGAAGFVSSSREVVLSLGETEFVNITLREERPEIETITVSASRYEISRDIASSRFQLDQRSIQNMPDMGEDPIRITQRLPGAAASGASAKTHFRGGTDGEIGVMLNGQWLFDPYHVRDYQSVFSAIDARAISGVEVYTGGFPAQYGDRMSGLVLMESMELQQTRHTEIGISVFNTSVLTSGAEGDLRWLFSARRGNLDLVIDPKFGKPSYYDAFGEVAFELSADSTLSFNALYADDRVKVALEDQIGEQEQIVSNTRNAQFWVQLQNRWSESLSSTTVFSVTSYDNLREGFTNDFDKIVSSVTDDRHIEQIGLRQDWTWNPTESHLLQWGLQAVSSDARYDYAGSAEYYGLQGMYENVATTGSRTLSAAPSGGSFALYVSDRWRLTPRTTFEWGLRWDDQTYTNPSSDSQVSPRFNVLHALNSKTELRLTWGRYNYAFRLELFHKDMSRVTPRFENLYNPLGLIPELQPDRIRIDPVSAESTGLEVSLDRSVGAWDWWASYTLSEVTDRIDDRDVPRSWDQRHSFQGGLSWSNEKWSGAIAASIHSGWPTTDLAMRQTGTDLDGDPVYVVTPGPRNERNHPTFASLDFRVSRTIDVRRGSLMAFIEVSNALDRRNICCIDWDTDEEVDGSQTLERGLDYLLPMLPAIGILWEF
jgi:hypothetical protein